MVEADAKKVLFEIADVLEDVGLEYMLYGGTCLGAVREGKFIEIDRDVDLACKHSEFKIYAEYLAFKFEELDFEVHVVDHRHEAKWNGELYGLKLTKYGINIDLFGWFNVAFYRWCPSHLDTFCLTHRMCNFDLLRKITFYGREFNIPMKVNKFLSEKYGNWREPHKEFGNVSKPTCKKEDKSGDDFWWV